MRRRNKPFIFYTIIQVALWKLVHLLMVTMPWFKAQNCDDGYFVVKFSIKSHVRHQCKK